MQTVLEDPPLFIGDCGDTNLNPLSALYSGIHIRMFAGFLTLDIRDMYVFLFFYFLSFPNITVRV